MVLIGEEAQVEVRLGLFRDSANPDARYVGVLTRGVTPMSEFVCVFPLPNGDARMTQRFILVRAREGPTSSGGGDLLLSCT
jgi:hypothetical protein